MSLTGRVALAVCLVATMTFIAIIGLAGWHRGINCGLFYRGCDPVCYSLMAASIREARESGKPVDYALRDEQTEFLIAKFQQSGLPDNEWRQAIAPHGYHYFTLSGQVGPQYPPGAPWALSLFRSIGAIYDLNRLSILLIGIGGLAWVAWCAHRRLALSCLIAGMGTYAFLAIFTWVDIDSFSVNALILPLFACLLFAWMARDRTRGALSVLLAAMAGLGLGLTLQDRVASVLLIPTMLLFFLPRRWPLTIPLAAGFMIGGIAPILLHDKLVTGSYFRATYDTSDTEQSLACIGKNLNFYWERRSDTSGAHILILALALVALVILIRLTTRDSTGSWRKWCRAQWGLILAPPSALLLGAAFFLTHKIVESYYLTPSMLTVVMTLVFLFVALDLEWQSRASAVVQRAILWGTVPMALIAVYPALFYNWDNLFHGMDDLSHPPAEESVDLTLPDEMKDRHAWLWADDFSGSIRLYAGHPAFKTVTGSSSTRDLIFGWVQARGEPQYLVEDSESMRHLVDEVKRKGWNVTLVGYARDNPCYRMSKSPTGQH